MNEEIWKDILWAVGVYQVSSLGRVRNIDNWNKAGVYLKQTQDKAGYLRIRIQKDYGGTPLVHRIVALTFIPNPENKPWVNHKNGNKADNRVENLEWSTISENVSHAYNNGLNWAHKGESVTNSKLKVGDVLKIRELSKLGSSRVSLAEKFNVTPEHISGIVLRKTWSHVD